MQTNLERRNGGQAKIRVWIVERRDRGKFTLRWTDPATGRRCQRTCDARSRRDAIKAAGAIEAELRENGGQLSDGRSPTRPTWDDFCLRYKREALASTSYSNKRKWLRMVDWCDQEFQSRGVKKPMLADVTPEFVAAVRHRMSEGGNAAATIASGVGTLVSGLNWAASLNLCQSFVEPKTRGREVNDDTEMRGRPLTDDEIALMCRSIGKTKQTKALQGFESHWRHLIQGLHLGGLRIGDAMKLRVSGTKGHVPLGLDERPRIHFDASQKSRKRQIVAITPDFAQHLRTTAIDADGWFFNPMGQRGRYKLASSVGKMISKLGQDLNIRTTDVTTATAHDLRRTFARRWSTRVFPPTLQHLMRHRNIETTMRFYVGNDADTAARAVYEAWQAGDFETSIDCDQACDQVLAV